MQLQVPFTLAKTIYLSFLTETVTKNLKKSNIWKIIHIIADSRIQRNRKNFT